MGGLGQEVAVDAHERGGARGPRERDQIVVRLPAGLPSTYQTGSTRVTTPESPSKVWATPAGCSAPAEAKHGTRGQARGRRSGTRSGNR